MASWTSILTRNPEAVLVSFDGTTAIFRINGLPKKNDITKLREAYEQAVYSANDIRKLSQQFYGTKEYWGYYEKHIAPSMIQRDSRPMTFEPAKPKKKDGTLLKSIVLLFLLLLPNGLFFWSLLFKMLGSGI